MSNIYIQEPPTNGKVLLKTTVGDVDIELWSKEAPKSCRNFVQLCLEGYYDGTAFHRVVKDFIVQGGDPTDTGEGGESIYGAPFKDEFHSRLRFVRRGLVAMANAGPHDNGSQFFFTMAATPELQNKHTIFGKVVGDTLFNMLKLQEVDVNEASERPQEPHRIISTEVLNNPFDDIVPRQIKRVKKEKDEEKKIKSKSKATKNFSLLSFGDEAEDDEEQVDKATESFRGKSKSSHDLTDDPRLSSVPAFDKEQPEEEQRKKKTEGSPEEGKSKKPEGVEEEAIVKPEPSEAEDKSKLEPPDAEGKKRKSDTKEEEKKRRPDVPDSVEKKSPLDKKSPVDKRSPIEKKSPLDKRSPIEKKSPVEKKSPSEKKSPVREETEGKKKKPEAEEETKKSNKEEAKEEERKKKTGMEVAPDSRKRKQEEIAKDDKKKRSRGSEADERKKRKGETREEETRKKRKGDEVKEEGKKKIKAEADSISQPAEEEKSSKDEVHHKLKKEKEESSRGKESKSLLASSDESKQNRVEELKKEQRRLHRDIKDFNKKRSNADDKAKVKPEEKDVEDNKDDSTEDDLLVMVKQERQKYKQQKKQLGRLGNREDATLAMLASFEKKLSAARTLAGDYDDVEEEKTVEDEEDDADDMSWMRHKLHFEEVAQKTKVIDANIPDSDRYALNDPRNPLNQRRRESSKRAMREKR